MITQNSMLSLIEFIVTEGTTEHTNIIFQPLQTLFKVECTSDVQL